jgi:transposase
MAKELVSDELWEVIEPLLPPESPKPQGGRRRVDDRAALTDIIFVLKSGIPWEMLPQERAFASYEVTERATNLGQTRLWIGDATWKTLDRASVEVLVNTKV